MIGPRYTPLSLAPRDAPRRCARTAGPRTLATIFQKVFLHFLSFHQPVFLIRISQVVNLGQFTLGKISRYMYIISIYLSACHVADMYPLNRTHPRDRDRLSAENATVGIFTTGDLCSDRLSCSKEEGEQSNQKMTLRIPGTAWFWRQKKSKRRL